MHAHNAVWLKPKIIKLCLRLQIFQNVILKLNSNVIKREAVLVREKLITSSSRGNIDFTALAAFAMSAFLGRSLVQTEISHAIC